MAKKGIKSWFSENKSALYVGIVGSLIWQIIVFIIDIIPNVGTNAFETIENSLYSLASTMSIARMLVVLFSFLMGAILGIGTYKIFNFITNKIILIKNKFFVKYKSEKSEQEIIKNKINKCFNSLSVLSIIITIIIGFNMIAFLLKLEFDLDMTSIKPYISEKEFDILMSDWTQMKTKDDYEKIYNTINKVQKENKLSSAKERLK